MFVNIAATFIDELRNIKKLRVIVSDSSDEEPEQVLIVQKRRRGRPKIEQITEETIDLIEEIDLAVQEVEIEGVIYNKCIYTSRLYSEIGRLVGKYDKSRHMIV
jgi:hypothetical protein